MPRGCPHHGPRRRLGCHDLGAPLHDRALFFGRCDPRMPRPRGQPVLAARGRGAGPDQGRRVSATGGRRLAVAACAVAGAAVTGLLALAVTLAGDGPAEPGTVRVVVERPAITTPVPDAAPSDAPAQRVRVATEPPAARATAAVARLTHR